MKTGRRAVTELYFKNYSSRVIAEKLTADPKLEGCQKVSHVTVSRDIVTIKKELGKKQEAKMGTGYKPSRAKETGHRLVTYGHIFDRIQELIYSPPPICI